jgi:hypothetical protein
MKSATQKLSKADRDTSVRELRASGRSAAAVIGEAAKLGGLLDCSRLVAAHDAAALVGDSGRSFA